MENKNEILDAMLADMESVDYYINLLATGIICSQFHMIIYRRMEYMNLDLIKMQFGKLLELLMMLFLGKIEKN